MSKTKPALPVQLWSLDAEQAVLGALLLVPEAWTEVCDVLEERDFWRADHQLIWRSIQELQGNTVPPDAVTLGDWFDAQGIASLVGDKDPKGKGTGSRYILELANTTPSAANILAYADIVKEYSRRRRVQDIAAKLAEDIAKPGAVARNSATDAVTRLMDLSDGSENVGAVDLSTIGRRVMEGIQFRFDNPNVLNGIPWPWDAINDATDGCADGELIIIGARPSIGKTAAALNAIAHWGGTLGLHGALFELEMSEDQLYKALMPIMHPGLTRKFLRRPSEGEDLSRHLAPAMHLVQSLDVEIDCRAGVTAAQICARARRLHAKRKLRYVVIDHAHILRLPGKREMREELADASKMSKALAKELGCPVILLAQLNRDLEKRSDKRPIMSDLREAGAFEQDADVIAFLHRDERYAKQERRPEKNPGTMEWIFAKQRESELCTCFTGWNGARGYLPNTRHEPDPELPLTGGARKASGTW